MAFPRAPRATRPVSPTTAALLLVACVAGCAAPEPAGRGLARHASLGAWFPRAAGPWIASDAWVTLAGEQRPALDSVRVVRAPGSWLGGNLLTVTAPWPAGVPVPRRTFARLVRLTSSGPVELPPVLVDGPAGDAPLRLGPFYDAVKRDVVHVSIQATPVPDLPARDLVGAPLDVPAGAVLDIAYGIEEAAWIDAAAAVEFTVTAIGDPEIVLHRAMLDPARRPTDRRWVDARVPLDAVAGAAVRLRLAARAVAHGDASLPVWAEPRLLVPRTDDPPLGVVLISLDTLRGASTISGGASRHTMPILERAMVAEGVDFTNAITTAPHTLPAHVSLFTGRYLRSHGVRAPLAVIQPDHRTVTEALDAAGWATAAFTENAFVVPEVGIRRGFHRLREIKSPGLHKPEGFAASVFGDGLGWLSSHRDQPFFLFLHTYQVHLPYTPPPPYDVAFEPVATLATEAEVNLLRYEQEARYLDDLLGVFLDGLDALGLRERTLVIVTADHGEEFREHGRTTHGYQLYDEVARVPLVVRLPGFTPAGHRVGVPVSLIDVAPTILDVVGLAPLPGADGRSLVPLLLDGAGPFERDTVYAETISGLAAPSIDVIAVRQEALSCVFQLGRGQSECYDRTTDPRETAPLRFAPDDHRGEAVRTRVAEFVRRGAAAAGGTPVVGVPDAERLEKLRALGYVD